MARKLFDREINDLIHSMTELGNKVDGRIQMTIDALRTLDMEKAKYVATSDGEIDGEEHKIEQMCMNLIALQQPIASDLRTIAACLKTSAQIFATFSPSLSLTGAVWRCPMWYR